MFDVNDLARRLGNRRTALAISGGVDSMVMLDVIAGNRDLFDCDIHVVHVDHGLRTESSSWSDMVHDVCRGYGIGCTTWQVDVRQDGNLENEARQARYMALSVGSTAIVTAHHMDDQAETVLMKLMRGSGPNGLMGMPMYGPSWFDESIMHCRPMLGIGRDDIVAYAKLCQLRYVTDPSNANTSFDRNWLRNDIMPLVKARKPEAVMNIARSAEILGESRSLMADLAEIDLASVRRDDGSLHWPSLKQLGRTRTKNLVLHLLHTRTGRGCSTRHIDMFVDGLMSADADSRNELRCGQVKISKIGHKILLCD